MADNECINQYQGFTNGCTSSRCQTVDLHPFELSRRLINGEMRKSLAWIDRFYPLRNPGAGDHGGDVDVFATLADCAPSWLRRCAMDPMGDEVKGIAGEGVTRWIHGASASHGSRR